MIGVNNLTRSKVNAVEMKRQILKILKILKITKYHYLDVVFVTPKKISELHKKYLDKSGPTTVISVESGKSFRVGNSSGLGEIYLCPAEIKKSGLPNEYFLIHAILHLVGFDHKTEKQASKMLAKEKEICANIGI